MFVFNPLINVQYLQEIYGDDLSIVQIMFESFLEDIMPIWEKILDEINTKNFKNVSEMAHQIKPSFSMAGLLFLHPKIQDFELYAKGMPDFNVLLAKYQSLCIEVSQARIVIAEELIKLNDQLAVN